MRRRVWFGVMFAAVVGMSGLVEAQDAKRVEITATKFKYSPAEITLKKGQPVVLVIKSMDVAHGLRVKELNFLLKVEKGGTAEAGLTPEKTGTFVGHCAVFCGSGHGGMALTVHVVE
jgi:cytochrome c oxidase subunit II